MSSIDGKGVNENSHDNSKDDMENGTYEVIKNRLLKQGTELKERVEKLNEERKKKGVNENSHDNSKDDMENGTYEVIKNRLLKQGTELKERVEKLNEERKNVFGSIETKILGSERVITEHNCIPRDMAPVEEYFIFGYNVHIGLKSKVELSDVFSIYKYENRSFIKQSLQLINDKDFINDFDELYKYYKNTFFAKFTITEPYFYMIFQTGRDPEDIKVFKWAIEGNKLIYVDSRSETKILGSERVITEHNCIPRDMAPVEEYFIFGYNVHIGLKSKVELSDVFSIYKYENRSFIKQSLQLINDNDFINDFDELYKYYKNTFFAKFTITEPYFYMIFQTGRDPEDIKVFKWVIEGNKLIYVDSRSEHEVRFKNRSEFRFIKATRDDQRNGLYPHVSIMDKVFVETIGGDLTIKVEDNTETGKGVYSEPVEDADQSLDDAEIYYADLEQIIILKIKPYKEEEYRYFIFNNKLKNVVRIDSIKDTCILLPGNHGIIFPEGYYLQNGEYKIFDVEADKSVFDERISSTNGEDYQYIFYNAYSGSYFIYSYNIIEQKIDTPIVWRTINIFFIMLIVGHILYIPITSLNKKLILQLFVVDILVLIVER